jgi:PAS domain S-box-containing protein
MNHLARCLQGVLLTILLMVPAQMVAAQTNQTLHFGGDWNYPPYEYLDQKGHPTGFNVELLQRVCQVMGLDCRITLGPWNQVREQLENGTIQGITGMLYSAQRNERVDFTTYHSIVSHSIFVPANSSISSINDLIDKSIGVQKGDIMHDYVLQNGISSTVMAYDNQEQALSNLANNTIDCALLARIQGIHFMDKLGIHNVKAVGQPILPRKYCFAVRKGDDVLRSQLNEGLQILKQNGEFGAIYDRWFSPYTRRDIHQKVISILMWFLAPMGIILLIIIAWSTTLKRQVREKTKSLHKELSQRKRAEKALVASQGNYRRVFHNAATCMMLLDKEGKIVMANQKCSQTLGYDHPNMLRGMSITKFMPDANLQQIVQACLMGDEEPVKRESQVKTWDGKTKDVVFSMGSFPNRKECIISVLDVSAIREAERERKRLEQELSHARKMEAVGTLAGGIAHDFNNLLQTISGNLYFLQKKTSQNKELGNYLRDMAYSVNRARELVRHLMTFSRKMEPTIEVVDVHDIIKRSLNLLQRTIPKMITLETRFSGEQCLVKVDPGQIEQILLNLVQNASDALNEGGRIILKTELKEIHRAQPMAGSLLQPGTYVCIQVQDNGPGMPPEIMEHIFEPFFTTKDVGKGTGLGLSSVFGIVKTHQGHIQCTSAVGQGTTMSLYFPRASSLEFALEAKTEQDTPHQKTQQTKATILLVDDEEMIRELTLEFLQEQGHTVLTAAGGEEALQLHEAHKGQIDLVIIDLGMPGMSGEQCIAKMLQQDSATPILVASGYSGHGIAQNPRAYGVMGFMNKPYNFDTLSTHIEEVLAHKGVHKK